MKLRLSLLGLPVHPFLVHIPIAAWVAVPVLDLAALLAGRSWWDAALLVTAVGVVIGALAIATGLLEYLEPSLAGIDMRLAARHGVRTSLAWCLFTAKLVLAALLPPGTGTIGICLLLDMIGAALLLQGVVFRHAAGLPAARKGLTNARAPDRSASTGCSNSGNEGALREHCHGRSPASRSTPMRVAHRPCGRPF